MHKVSWQVYKPGEEHKGPKIDGQLDQQSHS